MAAPTPRTGDRVLTLADTAVAAKLGSPQFQVRGGLSFAVSTEWQADSIAGGNTVAMKVEWFSDKSTLLSTQTLFDKVADAVDTWERFGGEADAPETARWARITLEKAANTFNAYFDRVAWDVDTSEAIDVFAGATHDLGVVDQIYVIIEYDTENFDRGDNYDTTTFTYTVPSTGTYELRAFATLGVDDPGEANIIEGRIRIRLNGTSTLVEDIVTGNTSDEVGVDTEPIFEQLDAGDAITVQGWGKVTGTATNATAIGGDGVTNFRAQKIS